MAACGLDPGRRDSLHNAPVTSNEHVVVSLVKFAADMMDALQKINEENFQQIKLRIGNVVTSQCIYLKNISKVTFLMF